MAEWHNELSWSWFWVDIKSYIVTETKVNTSAQVWKTKQRSTFKLLGDSGRDRQDTFSTCLSCYITHWNSIVTPSLVGPWNCLVIVSPWFPKVFPALPAINYHWTWAKVSYAKFHMYNIEMVAWNLETYMSCYGYKYFTFLLHNTRSFRQVKTIELTQVSFTAPDAQEIKLHIKRLRDKNDLLMPQTCVSVKPDMKKHWAKQ